MRLVVARIGRAHGILGEVTVELRTDVPEQRFVPGARLFVSDGARHRELIASGLPTTLTVTRVRIHRETFLLGFAEVRDRTAAEAMRDALVEAEVPDEVDEPDAWYDHQLVGLAVHDVDGALLGEVVGIEHLPAQDLLVVRRPAGHERLVPFVKALVPDVDLETRRVVVSAPVGLLDEPEDDAAKDHDGGDVTGGHPPPADTHAQRRSSGATEPQPSRPSGGDGA
jgi:16S rRNA processing protein RimM